MTWAPVLCAVLTFVLGMIIGAVALMAVKLSVDGHYIKQFGMPRDMYLFIKSKVAANSGQK